MEKNADKYKRFCRNRLLICLAIALNGVLTLFAASFDRTGGYEVKPMDSRFFVGQECGYVLELPGVTPNTVQMDIPDTPADIRFLTFKKEEYIDSEGYQGTRLQAWFMFSVAMTSVRLPSFRVKIGSRQYIIPVKAVTVYEDPERLFPELSVVFDGNASGDVVTVQAGETVEFTLYVRYCTQLLRFLWDLPKNAIFTEVRRYDIAKGKPLGKEFSPDPVPVAKFSWTPLVAGEYSLPPISVEAIAYNGARRIVVPAGKKLVVHAASQADSVVADKKDPADILFSQAFALPAAEPENVSQDGLQSSEQQVSDSGVSEENIAVCKKLAQLRCAEHNSLPFSHARAERKAYEEARGITAPAEPSKPLPVILLAAAVACALLSGALFFLRHPRKMLLPLIAAIAFLGMTLWAYASLASRYGIFVGGMVSPVPEETVSSAVHAAGGVRVKILEKADGWVYITGDECAGWVKSGAVLLIE